MKKTLGIIAMVFVFGAFAGSMVGVIVDRFFLMAQNFEPQRLTCPANKVEIQKIPVIEVKQDTLVLTETIVLTEQENEIYNMVNQVRIEYGLPPLTLNKKLVEAARAHATDMIKKDYFAHTTPEGKIYYEWITDANKYFVSTGENIAKNYKTATATIEGWKKSEKHYQNIIKEIYTDTGVGVVGNITVQFFGKIK
jgi:uncharacterized protein YkwD